MYVFIFIDTEPGVFIIVQKFSLLFDHCIDLIIHQTVRQGKSFRKAG